MGPALFLVLLQLLFPITAGAAPTETVTGTVVEVRDRDRYGRLVGIVRLPDGKSLNEVLVEAGLAWWYRTYAPDDAALRRAEQQARDTRGGLWSRAGPVPPWEWRRGSRGAVYSGSTSARNGMPCSRASFIVLSAFDSATSLV
ncbi:MAG: hypothetical protein GVY23_09560 [Spirochaetes bacterium]|nr:hypothetical protein [Spirochaetota bacterium]